MGVMGLWQGVRGRGRERGRFSQLRGGRSDDGESDPIRPNPTYANDEKSGCQISLVKIGGMVMISPSVRKNDLSNMVNPQVNSVQ